MQIISLNCSSVCENSKSLLGIVRAFRFQQVIQEKGVPIEIAPREAARFAGEAVSPCEARALHPSWSVGFGAGVDIEGKAY